MQMMKRGFITAEEGLRLAYVRYGEGTPSLVVPGACLLAADFEPLVQERPALFYDMRGRGGSDPSPDPWAAWTDYEVQDLESVRRALGIPRMALVGWSYLSGVAALYADQYPDRVERLILVCPIPLRYPAVYDFKEDRPEDTRHRISPTRLKKLAEMRKNGDEQRDPVEFCRAYNRVYLPSMMGKPAAFDRMRSDPCIYPNEWPDAISSHRERHFRDETWLRDWRETIARLEVPVLVINGEEDPIPPAAAREWASLLPDARLISLTGVGHFPHLEAPDRFFPAVDTFLRGSWPAEAAFVHS